MLEFTLEQVIEVAKPEAHAFIQDLPGYNTKWVSGALRSPVGSNGNCDPRALLGDPEF